MLLSDYRFVAAISAAEAISFVIAATLFIYHTPKKIICRLYLAGVYFCRFYYVDIRLPQGSASAVSVCTGGQLPQFDYASGIPDSVLYDVIGLPLCCRYFRCRGD